MGPGRGTGGRHDNVTEVAVSVVAMRFVGVDGTVGNKMIVLLGQINIH